MKKRYSAACLASLAMCTTWGRPAAAEQTLVETKDGWSFTVDGRINAFASYGFGDGFPSPVGSDHEVTSNGIGWSTEQDRPDGKYNAFRIRSGFLGNVFGFGVKKQLDDVTSVRGYLAFWSAIQNTRRDVWEPVTIDVREGYLKLDSYWGGILAGRTLGLFGRGSTEIDFLYGHNFGLGHPCVDAGGPETPGCGHIGTGVMFPTYMSTFMYNTPRIAGLDLTVGVFDPVRQLGAWERAYWPMVQGRVTFEQAIGALGKVHVFAEGAYQPVYHTVQQPGPDGMPQTDDDTFEDNSSWGGGVAGGARLEIGPARLGLAAFYGKALTFFYALQNAPGLAFDPSDPDLELRKFDGYYGQGALVFGDLQVSAGAGIARLYRTDDDKNAPALSLPKQQMGVSAAVYYHISDAVVLGLDYFRLMARWYRWFDPNVMAEVGGEKQDVNFVNAGITLHW